MDPFIKLWMFENWQADLEDDSKLAKDIAYLIGWFIDPERAKKLMGIDGNTHVSSDEEFEASMKMVKDASLADQSKKVGKKKKKKAKLKELGIND